MSLPVIIMGSGGHAKVLIEVLRSLSTNILGITERDSNSTGMEILGIRVLGNDDVISQYAPDSILLVNGIGSIDRPKARMEIFERFKKRGFSFATIIHPSVVVAADVILGEGVQIMAGVVIQPSSRIGVNTLINTNASVDHDCIIGDHVHLSPGVTLSGSVHVGNLVHVGTGATVIQGITIGKCTLIGAGSVVISNIPDNAVVIGVPARKRKTKLNSEQG